METVAAAEEQAEPAAVAVAEKTELHKEGAGIFPSAFFSQKFAVPVAKSTPHSRIRSSPHTTRCAG